MPSLRDWDAVPTPGVVKRRYQLGKHLGSGGFGQVVLARCLKTGNQRAVKAILTGHRCVEQAGAPSAASQQKGPTANRTSVEEEVRVAGKLQHPYVAFLYESLWDGEHTYLVMELCTGGNLASRVAQYPHDPDERRPRKGLPVAVVARYMWQMVAGIAYLHHHKIVHRDIKLENYLLKSRSDKAALKLIDFGFACEIGAGEPLVRRVGTAEYLAPEVLRGPYDEKCDIYGIGVCSYFAVTARMPYEGGSSQEVFAKAAEGKLQLKPSQWFDVPAEAQGLIRRMLAMDPAERPSADGIMGQDESWLRKHGWDPSEPWHPAEAEEQKSCCAVA